MKHSTLLQKLVFGSLCSVILGITHSFSTGSIDVENDNYAAIKLLIDKVYTEINLDTQKKNLINAVENNNYAAIKLLLGSVDVTTANVLLNENTNQNGNPPLNIAIHNLGYAPKIVTAGPELLRNLEEAEITLGIDSLYDQSSAYSRKEIAKAKEKMATIVPIITTLIDYGADVNKQGNNQYAPLHLATLFGQKEIVKVSLQAKDIQLDIQENQGNTPLHIAAHQNEIDIARMLIEQGAKQDITNKAEKTPLDIANMQRHLQIANMLKAESTSNIRQIQTESLWQKAWDTAKAIVMPSINFIGNFFWRDNNQDLLEARKKKQSPDTIKNLLKE